MLRHFCTFAHRTCRTNTRRQLRQCTDIFGDSFVQSSTRIRNYYESKDKLSDEKSNNLPTVRSRLKTYRSNDSKTENDKKNAETNDCTGIEKIKTITAMPELISDRKMITLEEDIELRMPNALDNCTEDVSDIASYTDPPRTFAYIAESSDTVQQLIKLGVKLYKLEKNQDIFRKVSHSNFELQIKPRIEFLHYNGVQPADLGQVINDCPQILILNRKVLDSRINYLKSHKFTEEEISMIITKKSSVLALPMKLVDERLRSIQQLFRLTKDELRGLISHQPRVLTTDERNIIRAVGYIVDVLNFNKYQLKELILTKPMVFVRYTGSMVDSCMFAMEQMRMNHKDIIKNPQILVCKKQRLECRHKFLEELNKAQYNPQLPGYIPPSKITEGDDEKFCKEVAKCDIDLYNIFLKTF